jgi:hypothetical protein
MPDYKKLDDVDILIKSEPMTPEERAAFSAFIKKNKVKNAALLKSLQAKKKLTAKAKSR